MSLNYANKYSTYIIENLPSSHLLKVLGLRQGTKFMVQTKQPLGGPVVIKVGNRSIAVDYDIAKNIMIKEASRN